MKAKLMCMICGRLSKATLKHFPITKTTMEGNTPKLEGYICKLCVVKGLKAHARKV